MRLIDLLREKRAIILQRWFDLICESYPPETSNLLKNEKNRFTNPVGYAISDGIEGLLRGLLDEMDSKADDIRAPFLDNIIRIRAVQDFTPSQAISFIFLLKNVIREELKTKIHENGIAKELFTLESRIDGLALLSFDIYMKCREKIYELRVNELKKRMFT